MNVLMVSTYPPTKCGVAYYTRSLVRHLCKEGCKVSVLTDRMWKKNDILLPLKIIKYSSVDITHIQHEFLLYGHPYTLILIILALVLLKVRRFLVGRPKKIVITMHSVLRFSEITPQLFISHKVPMTLFRILKCLGCLLYKFFVNLPDAIVIHTPECKKILENEIRTKSRVFFIPHGLEPKKSINVEKMDQRDHNIIRLLIFGFLRPTKDYGTAIRALRFLPNNFHLFVKGGAHPSYDIEGLKVFSHILKLIKELDLSDRVHLELGFVNKDKAFEDADIVLLPYTQLYGGSGALCDAIAYGKLFLTTDNPHFRGLLELWGWRHFIEVRDPKSLAKVVEEVFRNKMLLVKIVAKLQDTWNWRKISCFLVEYVYG